MVNGRIINILYYCYLFIFELLQKKKYQFGQKLVLRKIVRFYLILFLVFLTVFEKHREFSNFTQLPIFNLLPVTTLKVKNL